MSVPSPHEFVARWIGENISAEGYQADGDNAEGLRLAEQCREAAAAAGFDLSNPAFKRTRLASDIAGAIERASDREAGRLASKGE